MPLHPLQERFLQLSNSALQRAAVLSAEYKSGVSIDWGETSEGTIRLLFGQWISRVALHQQAIISIPFSFRCQLHLDIRHYGATSGLEYKGALQGKQLSGQRT